MYFKEVINRKFITFEEVLINKQRFLRETLDI